MSRRGRRATFPNLEYLAYVADPEALVRPLDPRRFQVRTGDKGELTLDLSSWSHPEFAVAFAPLLQELIRRIGPAPLKRTICGTMQKVRRFWGFLDQTGTVLNQLDDVTADLINRYENWLEQNVVSQSYLRTLIRALIEPMRLAVENEPDRFPHDLVTRLSWLGGGARVAFRPRDAYSSRITAAVRVAARTQVADAMNRLLPADKVPPCRPDIEACPALHPYYDDVVQTVIRRGCISATARPFNRLKRALQYRRMSPLSAEDLHAQFHLTHVDVVGFLALLSLETGMEIECLAGLKADCLCNPSRGYVEIEYCKLRARGAEWKRLRVRDGGSSTPGGIIRQAIRLTEPARKHTGADALWTWWCVATGLRPRGVTFRNIATFVQRHGLTNDDGRPLNLELARLRKTQKAERYLKTQGQMEIFATGHTIEVAARHYGDIPALRHVHEQTIADALQEALDASLKPMLLSPAMEEVLHADPEALDLPVPPDRVDALLNGEQEVWLANCGNFHASPFGRQGEACPTPFWGCLECSNAVITARKLPALLAFDAFMVAQRVVMDQAAWSGRFARAHHRIVDQILPAFSPEIVANARAIAAKGDAGLLYLPPEAGAW